LKFTTVKIYLLNAPNKEIDDFLEFEINSNYYGVHRV